MRRACIISAVCVAFAWVAPNGAAARSRAPRVTFGPSDIPSAFHIGKSENRNEVHYGVRLDETCTPVGSDPVFAYWRLHERRGAPLEPLLAREEPLYGLVLGQRVERRPRRAVGDASGGPERGAREGGGTVRAVIRGIPHRPVLVETFPTPSGCAAVANVVINDETARLERVFVKLGLGSVEYVLLTGRHPATGRAVEERLRM
jgi:hypothetical protein